LIVRVRQPRRVPLTWCSCYGRAPGTACMAVFRMLGRLAVIARSGRRDEDDRAQ